VVTSTSYTVCYGALVGREASGRQGPLEVFQCGADGMARGAHQSVNHCVCVRTEGWLTWGPSCRCCFHWLGRCADVGKWAEATGTTTWPVFFFIFLVSISNLNLDLISKLKYKCNKQKTNMGIQVIFIFNYLFRQMLKLWKHTHFLLGNTNV
jgi:hypothetical protein